MVGGVGGCFLLESVCEGCFCEFMGILCRRTVLRVMVW